MSVSYEEELLEDLKNPSEAAAYLSVSIADEDPHIFPVALDRVVRARAGLASFSTKGSLKLNNVRAILRSLGMKLSLETIDAPPSHHS